MRKFNTFLLHSQEFTWIVYSDNISSEIFGYHIFDFVLHRLNISWDFWFSRFSRLHSLFLIRCFFYVINWLWVFLFRWLLKPLTMLLFSLRKNLFSFFFVSFAAGNTRSLVPIILLFLFTEPRCLFLFNLLILSIFLLSLSRIFVEPIWARLRWSFLSLIFLGR